MDSHWATQAFPSPPAVLKLRLRPLAPGHEILLARISSPFVVGGPIREQDLLSAALLCSATFRDGLKLLRSPARMRLFAAVWRLVNPRRILWPAELARFLEYLQAGRWSPEVCEMGGAQWETRSLNAPRAWRLIHFLCSQMQLTEAQALDFPCARAACYFATKCDLDGSVRLAGGAEDEDLIARHNKFMAEHPELAGANEAEGKGA